MVVIECKGADPQKCPVRAWRGDGYDGRRVPDEVILHGFDRDGEQRYRCNTCCRTFTLARTGGSQHNLPKGVASFHEYLMLETAWLVDCMGVKTNVAARMAGVDWKTVVRWHARAYAKWGTGLCATLDEDDYAADVAARVYGLTTMGSNGTAADERWMRTASAARLLMEVRTRQLITADEHKELRWLTDRARNFEPEWAETVEHLRIKLRFYDMAPPS